MDRLGDEDCADVSGGQGAPLPALVVAAPATVAALLQTAFAHHRTGRTNDAAVLYRQILVVEPEHADAMHFLGLLLCDTGEHATGIKLIEQSILLQPDATYFSNLGNVLGRQGQHDAAIAAYREALARRPDYVEAHNNLGNALRIAADPLGAMESCANALALQPDYVEAWSNLGDALTDHGSFDAAMKSYAKALGLRPDYAEAHNNLGNLFEKQGRLDEATACYRKAIALKPGVAAMHNNLGNVLRDQGFLDEAVACFRKAIALDANQLQAHSNLLLQLNLLPHAAVDEQLDAARRFGEQQVARARPFVHEFRANDLARRLRVGFVSGDLNTHPVGFFLESVLAHLDKARFELVAYVTRLHEDALTARLKPHFSAWHRLASQHDEACAKRIHADGIDILVDLSGHTNHNRLSMFAWKPAPVQVSWLGYFATTGLRAIDYILGDRHVLPDAEAAHFVEQPWRLPDSYVCFTPPVPEVQIGTLPVLGSGTLTFGCFNHLVKLNDAVIELWARVLRAVPESRLYLKTRQLGDSSMRRAMSARFAALGIDDARLTLEGASPRTGLLEAYNRVDIALDPFPYPGGTTTIEALWMGVPVLTRRGDRFLSHIGESILHNVGLAQWIARDNDDYVEKAVSFAAAHDYLKRLRAGLRQQLHRSPLCDAARFARNLEAAFRGMWRQYAAGSQAGLHPQAVAQQVVNTERHPPEKAPNHAGHIST